MLQPALYRLAQRVYLGMHGTRAHQLEQASIAQGAIARQAAVAQTVFGDECRGDAGSQGGSVQSTRDYGSSAVGELISDACGVLVPERSAAALANALDQLLFERTYDREAIKRKAAHHAPAAVLERYRTIYEELAAS